MTKQKFQLSETKMSDTQRDWRRINCRREYWKVGSKVGGQWVGLGCAGKIMLWST